MQRALLSFHFLLLVVTPQIGRGAGVTDELPRMVGKSADQLREEHGATLRFLTRSTNDHQFRPTPWYVWKFLTPKGELRYVVFSGRHLSRYYHAGNSSASIVLLSVTGREIGAWSFSTGDRIDIESASTAFDDKLSTQLITVSTAPVTRGRDVAKQYFALADVYMNSNDADERDAVWEQLAPCLDDAMQKLGEADRLAVLLRFFQGKAWREIGEGLGIGEDAARMRVNRAIERLRGILEENGVACLGAVLGTVLLDKVVQVAPATLLNSVQAAGISAAKAGSCPAWLLGVVAVAAKAKLAALVAGALALLLGVNWAVHAQRKARQVTVGYGRLW